jgi:hypothetical protein
MCVLRLFERFCPERKKNATVDKGRAAKKALTQPENKVFKQLPPCLNGISKCLKSWVLQLICLKIPEKQF